MGASGRKYLHPEPPRSAYRGLIYSLPVALLMWCALVVAVVWVLAVAR